MVSCRNVGQRVRDRPLEDLLQGPFRGTHGEEGLVEAVGQAEEPLDLLLPCEGVRVASADARRAGARRTAREVPDVGQDLRGGPGSGSHPVGAEARGRPAQGLGAAIRDGRQRVPNGPRSGDRATRRSPWAEPDEAARVPPGRRPGGHARTMHLGLPSSLARKCVGRRAIRHNPDRGRAVPPVPDAGLRRLRPGCYRPGSCWRSTPGSGRPKLRSPGPRQEGRTPRPRIGAFVTSSRAEPDPWSGTRSRTS